MRHALIVARSGRALAASATRAGYQAHVIDAFADVDTVEIATTALGCDFTENGFDPGRLHGLVNGLLAKFPIELLVMGAGIEKAPDLPVQIGNSIRLYCNSASAVRTCVDPCLFTRLLNTQRVPHPAIANTLSGLNGPLLKKRIAGMGGEGVSWAAADDKASNAYYFQQYIPGEVCSVVFLADGKNMVLVGFNKQWQCQSFEDMPFLYAGACSIEPGPEQRECVGQILQSIVSASGLTGLCGMDYVVDKEGKIMVLEVNPRPPSTFELHEGEEALFEAHVNSFEQPLNGYQGCHQYRACVIIYARTRLQINRDFDWPVWTTDRPHGGSMINSRQPVCTVHAEADSVPELITNIESRKQTMESKLSSCEFAI